jgi:hypothetical protein
VLESIAGISTLLFILAGGAVSVRLTALAWRTGGFAEWMLGPGLFLVVGAGYPILITGQQLTLGDHAMGPLTLTTALVVMSVGWGLVWTFTWRVFRPEEAWARALALVSYLVLAITAAEGVHRALTIGEPRDILIPSWGAIGHQLNAMALFSWTGFEAFRYQALLRKRLALGLANPVVANRFFLWGVVSIFSIISMAGPLIAGLMGVDFMANPYVLLSVSVGGLTTAVTLYLAFLPPKAYLRRIERSSS